MLKIPSLWTEGRSRWLVRDFGIAAGHPRTSWYTRAGLFVVSNWKNLHENDYADMKLSMFQHQTALEKRIVSTADLTKQLEISL